MGAWIFIVLMTLPSFGGTIKVTFETTGQESCEKLRRVVLKSMDGFTMRYEAGTCEAKK